MNKKTKKEVSVDAFCITLGILILVLWSPVSYYLGKWSNWWDGEATIQLIGNYPNENLRIETENEKECRRRAEAYFGSEKIIISYYPSYASTTMYQSRCYGLKLTKIP